MFFKPTLGKIIGTIVFSFGSGLVLVGMWSMASGNSAIDTLGAAIFAVVLFPIFTLSALNMTVNLFEIAGMPQIFGIVLCIAWAYFLVCIITAILRKMFGTNPETGKVKFSLHLPLWLSRAFKIILSVIISAIVLVSILLYFKIERSSPKANQGLQPMPDTLVTPQ